MVNKKKKLPQFELSKDSIITGITIEFDADDIGPSESPEAYEKLAQGPIEFLVVDKDGNYRRLKKKK
ncbi:MAG: hypothetical protein RL078_1204 [Bacteroidota bacterium]|jgi:hypothetical protein